MRLADYSSSDYNFEFDPPHRDLLACEASDDRALTVTHRETLAALLDPTYDYLDLSLANRPVDLVPHDLSSLEKQRADFVATWSKDSRSTGSPSR